MDLHITQSSREANCVAFDLDGCPWPDGSLRMYASRLGFQIRVEVPASEGWQGGEARVGLKRTKGHRPFCR